MSIPRPFELSSFDEPHRLQLTSLLADVEDDPNVAGLVLTGSAAREGMATPNSDLDVYVVLHSPDPTRATMKSAAIDLPACTLDDLRAVPAPLEPDPEGWWERYSFAHTQILLDRTDGELRRLVDGWGTLSGGESKRVLETYLDGYINYVYRSLKSHRDGRLFEARLDATESLPWMLAVIFAFERRVRPYNKYLAWELRHHPLDRPEWQASTLLPQIEAILTTADMGAQRAVLRSVETAARDVGLGGIVDGWGDELPFVRGSGGAGGDQVAEG
jgi:Nucleotidyltransferase domain